MSLCRYIIGISLSVLSLAGYVMSQTCSVQISVRDFSSRELVHDAMVLLGPGTNYIANQAKANNGQMYEIGNLASGLYSMEVTKDGYKSSIKRLVVNCQSADPFKTSIYLLPGDRHSVVHVVDGDFETLISSNLSVNYFAIRLPKPAFPPEARGRSGSVIVRVLIKEDGRVISADPISGDSIFVKAAQRAARSAWFAPSVLNGKPVKITGNIEYIFES